MANTDPDQFQCYSDHAHDIATVSECTMCGSTTPEDTGHVLPDVARYRGVDPVDAARQVITAQAAQIFDGALLDHFTAQHIAAVADALSPANVAKLRAMSLAKASAVCFKLTAKAGA